MEEFGGIFGKATIDTYRNCLSRAGYLETIVSGQYKRVKRIPKGISINQVRKEAHDR